MPKQLWTPAYHGAEARGGGPGGGTVHGRDTMSEERISPAEYLVRERAAEYRSEYRDGRMVAMTGASVAHGIIVWNVGAALREQMHGRPCMALMTDMRVKVAATGVYTYPDVVAFCGEARLEDSQRDTLLNPSVIVEVLSPSTESYDRGKKFEQYRRLESLREYVLIAQDRMRVERYERDEADPERWRRSILDRPDAVLELAAVGCVIPLSDIYEQVTLGSATPGAGEGA